MKKLSFLFFLLLFTLSCQRKISETQTKSSLTKARLALKDYDHLAKQSVLVLGTFHFGDDVLESENQKSIEQLVNEIALYQPTKIVVEWQPKDFIQTNKNYNLYLKDSFDISTRYNEVYQLGFRMAKKMGHDSIYLFDDKTEFIGSLATFGEDQNSFSFDLFSKYAKETDDGFYNLHESDLISIYGQNDSLIKSLDLKNQIAVLNSPEKQKINAQRMHMYEVRVGIQKNWVGPDWLGRWYRRNIRMMSNVLKMSEEGDRVLIIVGDNHKWVLDRMFQHTPDFKLVPSWDYLKDD